MGRPLSDDTKLQVDHQNDTHVKIDKIHEILIILILVIIVIIVTPLIIVTIEGTPQASPPFPLLFSDQARPTGMQLSTGTHWNGCANDGANDGANDDDDDGERKFIQKIFRFL